MYILVKLLNGLPTPLTYKIPDDWHRLPTVGSIVKVPLRNAFVPALVTDLFEEFSEPPTFIIKPAHSIEAMPEDPYFQQFIAYLSHYYQLDESYFFKRMRQFLSQKEVRDHEPVTSIEDHSKDVVLTNPQQQIVDWMSEKISEQVYAPTLLHGVTGSGKTEVYKKLIEHTIAQGKSVLLLLPEVTLAVHFHHLLRRQLADSLPIFSFHSATSIKEKRLLWKYLLAKKPALIIGVHLPIMLPIPNLGFIIIDEEHEIGFQEKKHPKINSKEAALYRAQLCKIPILLGSATPSLTSLHSVKTKGWHFFQLKDRFAGKFPQIDVVSLNTKQTPRYAKQTHALLPPQLKQAKRSNFWISSELETAIAEQLRKQEQTIIFLNRRGYSFFVQCKSCSFIFSCSQCSVSLTLHDQQQLHCHYCGYTQSLPTTCPSCKGPESGFIKKGIGTQQVVSILQQLFPQARIARADLDSTVNKKTWQATMHAMQTGQIDILVGTQTITKGHHFPKVTLVGVLWADLNLNFPIFNATETTLQQLIQVAGRSGRSSEQSRVIIQTMIDHPCYHYLHEVDYLKFYATELQHRKEIGYPPYQRLAEIDLKFDDEAQLIKDTDILADRLIAASCGIQILGPAKPPIYKISNTYRRVIYLKSSSYDALIQLYASVEKDDLKSSVFFSPNPLTI